MLLQIWNCDYSIVPAGAEEISGPQLLTISLDAVIDCRGSEPGDMS
jgi:hypothetical protein